MNKLIIANFKMFKSPKDCTFYAKGLLKLVKKCKNEIAVCPSFVCIEAMSKGLKKSKVLCGGQNLANHIEGAYTGEVSAKMLKDAGAELVILGHSERRRYYGETDKIVNEKLKLALENGLLSVVCLADDGGAEYRENIKKQLKDLLRGVENFDQVVIAFEPVWAIGTGKTMELSQIESVLGFVKKELKKKYGEDIRVLYGGSVNASNAKDILSLKSVDGLLVGGASKDYKEFAKICHS